MASMSYYRASIIITIIVITFYAHCGAALSPHSHPTIESQSKKILVNSVESALNRLSSASSHFAVDGSIEKLITNTISNNGLALSALQSCRELLALATNNLNNTLLVENRDDINAWICAAGSNLHTCLDGFNDQVLRNRVFEKLESSIRHTRNSRAALESSNGDSSRRSFDRDPYWLSSEDRRMLQAYNVRANVVVAKDGSGNYSTISDALKIVPSCSNQRFVIYVRKGVYYENVKVDLNQWNVMMFGDGMNETVVSGNLSYLGGRETFYTATFTVLGQGFIARDMGFLNTAGPAMLQAVALLSAADQSAFYRCRIDAYQDTLYAQSNRQFYSECCISGTIDFIFGDAAIVVQNSNILVKKPLLGQENTIAAHQNADPKCRTGIVVQRSTIRPAEDLTGVKTFLGRPWSEYSTVVFMENYMSGLIDPRGWRLWNDFVGAPPPPSNVFLAEYNNRGRGAATAHRVRWQGVRVDLSRNEASKYTVKSFINGDQWLPATNVSYEFGLQ